MKTPAERVRDVYASTVRGIERRQDLDRAWSEATALDELVDELRADVTALRSRLAGRIKDRDELTLEHLATRLSVSPSRASQLVRGVRR